MRAYIIFIINIFAGVANLIIFYHTNKPINGILGVLGLYIANKMTKEFNQNDK